MTRRSRFKTWCSRSELNAIACEQSELEKIYYYALHKHWLAQFLNSPFSVLIGVYPIKVYNLDSLFSLRLRSTPKVENGKSRTVTGPSEGFV